MIDIREIRLGKWYIPKKQKTSELKEMEEIVYHALGYFDILSVKEVKNDDEHTVHPLVRAYEESHRANDSIKRGYFVQEIKAFTNISDQENQGFSQTEVQDFWGNTSPVMCLSMLHLYREIPVEKVVNRIKKVFQTEKYLYYFTFEYSGLVIVAKEMSVGEYIKRIFQISYYGSETERVVRDTFSVYSFASKALCDAYKQFDEQWSKDYIKESIKKKFEDHNLYEIALNVSICDYKKYLEFKERLDCFNGEYGYKDVAYKLIGRHDISIVNQKGDICWLLYAQKLLENYTEHNSVAFYSYETFIKVEDDAKCDAFMYNSDDETNEPLREIMKDIYEKFSKNLERTVYLSYKTPLREVYNSIQNILNGGFAEDFIICIFRSFCEFLKYMGDKIEETEKNPEEGNSILHSDEFENCFDQYFIGLNAMINSAMHMDRQFIHSTTFNAVFYDVPPKIMAMYVAVIERIKCIMKRPSDCSYNFFMTPSFSDEVSVSIISYREEKKPADRILRVCINEESLYDFQSVFRCMAHEIAHFVGDDLRNRRIRLEKYIETIVDVLLMQIIDQSLRLTPEGTIKTSFVELEKDVLQQVSKVFSDVDGAKYYSTDLAKVHSVILDYFRESEQILKMIKGFVSMEIKNVNIDNVYLKQIISNEQEHENWLVEFLKKGGKNEIYNNYFTQLVVKDIESELQRLCYPLNKMYQENSLIGKREGAFLGAQELKDYARSLLGLYSETYADMQMILVLDISFEKYLEEFLRKGDGAVGEITCNEEDMNRIVVIWRLMVSEEKWNDLELQSESESDVDILKAAIAEHWEKINQECHPYYTQNSALLEYLVTCMKDSEEIYNTEDKKTEIIKLRKDIKVLVEYKDAQELYEKVCEIISDYKKELLKMKD